MEFKGLCIDSDGRAAAQLMTDGIGVRGGGLPDFGRNKSESCSIKRHFITACLSNPLQLCVEMGFYADISWESRCNIEVNI